MRTGATLEGTWTFQDAGLEGQVANYTLKITERQGSRFRGEGAFRISGTTIRSQAEGTIQGNRIEYFETGDQAYRFHFLGALRNGEILLEFEGTGVAGNARHGIAELVPQ